MVEKEWHLGILEQVVGSPIQSTYIHCADTQRKCVLCWDQASLQPTSCMLCYELGRLWSSYSNIKVLSLRAIYEKLANLRNANLIF